MKMIQSGSKKFVSIVATLFVVLFGIMANGCGGGGGGGGTTPTVEAPGIPTNFVVTASPVGGDLSATLMWEAPMTGGEVASYELYKYSAPSTTPLHLISLPSTADGYTDNTGLERGVETCWIVAAKNAGGETSTFPACYTPAGGGGGEVDKYGNNLAAALIFADGVGITNEDIQDVWTEDNISLVDTTTGLRPTQLEIDAPLTEFPYFDENTTYLKDGVIYYKQKTISTWQGEWINGLGMGEHNVTAKWGDNLISQTLTTQSVVRIEMVFTKALDTNMTAYNMVSLYGEKDMEIYGTDGNTTTVDTAFVFTAYATLKIERLDALGGTPVEGGLVDEQALFDGGPDGPGQFAAEINVAGNLVYGYVWDVPGNNIPAGAYRITFTLNEPSNVTIGAVAVPDEGENPYTTPVLDSPTQVHIDIIINE